MDSEAVASANEQAAHLWLEARQGGASLPDPPAGWETLLGHLLPAEASPVAGASARELVRQLERLGYERSAAKAVLGRLIGYEAVQCQWASWTYVADRDELRLRLELLGRSGHLSESLQPFVLFFFRASVLELYKAAAIALGRHLHHCWRFQDYLRRYAGRRGVSLEGAIELKGQRSRRRLLLALTAAATGTPAPGFPSRPLHWQGERLVVPEDPMDRAGLAASIETALRAARPDPAYLDAADQLLQRFAADHQAMPNRTLIQRMGAMWATRHAVDPPPTRTDLWLGLTLELFQVADAAAERTMPEHVGALIRVDEALRTWTVLPDGALAGALSHLDGALQPRERAWARQRLRTWLARERGLGQSIELDAPLPEGPDEVADAPAHSQTVLRWAHQRHEVPPARSQTSRQAEEDAISRQSRFLHRLLGSLAEEHHWQQHHSLARAWISFYLLDETQYLELSPAQTRALLGGFGLYNAAEHAQPADGALSAFAAGCALVQLMGWEGPGCEEIVDARLLHRIDHPRAQLALLPTERRTPLLPLLADAFEHHLRWHLQSESGFSPSRFLYRLMVRRPHQAFWDQLHNLCADRPYTDAHDRPANVQTLVAWLHQQRDEGNEQPRTIPASLKDEHRFLGDLSALRQRLGDVQAANADLLDQLRTLLGCLSQPTPDGQSRPDTILGLLQALSPPGEPVISDDRVHWQPMFLAELIEQLQRQVQQLAAWLDQLVPENLADIDQTTQAVAHVEAALLQLTHLLQGRLPHEEARLWRHAVAELLTELRDWARVLQELHARLHALPAATDKPGEAVGAHLNALLRVIQQAHPSLRPTLIEVLWQTLGRWAQQAGQAGEDPTRLLLDWGLEADLSAWTRGEQERWRQRLAQLWQTTLEEAMQHHQEQRALRLLREPGYRPLRREPGSRALLERAQRWCFDHFLLGAGRLVRGDLMNAQPRSWVRESAAFAGHFSAVWLAMLIGGILMLDFGDAWVAMAEDDVRDSAGIAMTFLIGLGGTFLYVWADLRRKVSPSPGHSHHALRFSVLRRASAFTAICLGYTFALTGFLWYLLSATDEVIHGPWAIGHIVVWSGFALFIGVFWGLIAKRT